MTEGQRIAERYFSRFDYSFDYNVVDVAAEINAAIAAHKTPVSIRKCIKPVYNAWLDNPENYVEIINAVIDSLIAQGVRIEIVE